MVRVDFLLKSEGNEFVYQTEYPRIPGLYEDVIFDLKSGASIHTTVEGVTWHNNNLGHIVTIDLGELNGEGWREDLLASGWGNW